jgi:hypothetical protein
VTKIWEEEGGSKRGCFIYSVQEVHEILIDFLSTRLQTELKIKAVEMSVYVEIISRELNKIFGHAFK